MRTRKSSRSPVTGHESSIWQCLVLIASWQLLVTPLNAFVPSSSSSSFNPLTHVKDPQRQGKQSSQQSSSTAVSMGIRSLLGIGKNKKNKHEKDSSSSSPFPPTSARPRTATNTTTETSQSTKDSDSSPTESSRPPLRMGEDPTTKEVDVFQQAGAESIQDKINRIKSGSMTSSEKQAFLESALSAGTTAESRKPLSEAADDKPKVSASPFPTDSILRNFARGKPAKDPAGLTSSSSTKTKDPEPRRKLDSDKKKQEYLDMVTNPDRFQRYKKSSSTSGAGVERISGSVSAAAKTPISDIRKMDLKSKDDTDKDVKDEEEASAPTEPKSIPDLGARLGAAAMANENMRQQAEKERLERQKRMEEEKKEYERRAEEMARQRQAEIMRMEAEQAEKRRKAEEEQRKAEEEKKQKEKERLDALMKAQEEYWAKKLAKERAAKEEKLVEKEKQKEEEAEMAVEEGKEEIAAAVDVKPAKTAERFNPDERNLLELAEHDREEAWEEDQEIIEKSSSKILGKEPDFSHLQTEPDFIEEQARRKSEIDRQRELQLQRLKELNSPLPSPVEPGAAPPAFNPQKPASVPAPAAVSAPQPQPVQPPKASAVSPLKAVGTKLPPVQTPKEPETEAEPEPEPEATAEPKRKKPTIKAPWSSFFGGGGGDNGSSNAKEEAMVEIETEVMTEMVAEVVTEVDPEPVTVPEPTPEPEPVKASAPAPQVVPVTKTEAKKGPIRMKLPLDDNADNDEEEDEEDGVDVRGNKSMSIAEAMKRTSQTSSSNDQNKRSKQWGIDMSRFTD